MPKTQKKPIIFVPHLVPALCPALPKALSVLDIGLPKHFLREDVTMYAPQEPSLPLEARKTSLFLQNIEALSLDKEGQSALRYAYLQEQGASLSSSEEEAISAFVQGKESKPVSKEPTKSLALLAQESLLCAALAQIQEGEMQKLSSNYQELLQKFSNTLHGEAEGLAKKYELDQISDANTTLKGPTEQELTLKDNTYLTDMWKKIILAIAVFVPKGAYLLLDASYIPEIPEVFEEKPLSDFDDTELKKHIESLQNNTVFANKTFSTAKCALHKVLDTATSMQGFEEIAQKEYVFILV